MLKRQKKGATAFLCCVFLFACFAMPSSAYAFNADYLEPDKWMNTENAVSVPLVYESYNHALNGQFSYFADDNLALYTYFQISETSLKDENDETFNEVYLTCDFHMEGEDYSVTLGRDGLVKDSAPESFRLFETDSRFGAVGEYAFAAQYIGKEYTRCRVDVTLSVNGYNYRITQSEKLYGRAIELELPTTLRAEKTTAAKTTAKPKSKSAATTKGTTAKSKRETTTKFKPQYNQTTAAKSKADERSTEMPSGETDTPSEAATLSAVSESFIAAAGNTKMSRTARWYLWLALLLALAGLTALIIGNIRHGKEQEKAEENEEEKEENGDA